MKSPRVNTNDHDTFVNKSTVKFLCLNVCGLVRKSQYPDFQHFVSDYDILCFSETKTDDCDDINLDDFTICMKNRFKFRKVKSGGITLAYKNYLHEYISEIESDSKYIKWFKIDKHIFEHDILFGIVYIPPESSVYCTGDPFAEIEQEYLRFGYSYEHVCLLGDFNSRTSNCDDFMIIDSDHDELTRDIIENGTNANFFENCDIPMHRSSEDRRKNNFGNQLLEFCKYNDLYICNGIVGNDRNTGKLTCKNASVVDYVICSSGLFDIIAEFSILEFNSLYSDAHCPISFALKCDSRNNCHNSENEASGVHNSEEGGRKIKHWDMLKSMEFKNSINVEKINEILTEMENLVSIENNIDATDIDSITDKTCKILLDAATNTLGTYRVYNKENDKPNTSHKQWFNRECRIARKNFRQAKGRYRRQRNDIFFDRFKEAEKRYKKTMDDSIKAYRNSIKEKLSKLRTDNPKDYWRVLNSSCKERRKDESISIDTLHDFFRELNMPENDDDGADLVDVNIDDGVFPINCPIEMDELVKAVKGLKNDKASADDAIINEYIKNSMDKMCEVYLKLFNIIFDSGKIPETWLTGNIVPIYKNKGSKSDPKNYRPITIVSCLANYLLQY